MTTALRLVDANGKNLPAAAVGTQLERALLGALLDAKDQKRLLDLAGLPAEAMSDAFVRTCWAIVVDLVKRGSRADAFAVFSAARTSQPNFGDENLPALQALQSGSTLDATSFAQVAGDLRRHAHSQKLAHQLGELQKELVAGAPPACVQARFNAVREDYNRLHANVRTGPDVIARAMENHGARLKQGKPLWVTTGLKALDDITGGAPPKMCALIGEPGIGKTAAVGSMIDMQLQAGHKVLLVSLEDGDEWLPQRHLALLLKLPVRKVFNEAFPDEVEAQDAANALSNRWGNLFVVTKEQARTPAEVLRIATYLVAHHGVSIVWLDNMVRLRHEPQGKFESKSSMVGRAWDDFAEFADTYHVPFFAIAHTTRDYKKVTGGKGHPQISDISDSAEADRTLRFALALWRKGESFRATVVKHTLGKPGDTVEFDTHVEAALVNTDGGRVVNLQAEARKESDERRRRKIQRNLVDAIDRKAMAAEMAKDLAALNAPAEEKPKDAQLTLLDAPPVAPPANPVAPNEAPKGEPTV